MKRLLFLAAVAVLVPASAASAWQGERSIVAARKHAAEMSARKLLRTFVPPPDARRIYGWPRDYSHFQSVGAPLGKFVDIHRFWISHATLSSIVAFEKAHVPSGFSVSGGGTNAKGTETDVRFISPRHGVSTRLLVVSISQRKTRTIVRADAQVVWVYPRSPHEVVPSGVREIVVKGAGVNRRVIDPAKVGKIVHWFDRLPISPPGVSAPCWLYLVRYVTLDFRSANGARVARARYPAPRAGICVAIDFTIRGLPQTPLIDHLHGVSLAGRLQHLLGVRFSSPRR